VEYEIENIIDSEKILIKKIEYQNTSVFNLDLSIFSLEEKQRFDSFNSDKRRREFYFTRLLLKSFGVNISIQYRASGKPIINEGHISISHSRNTVIIGFSKDHFIGVDIEYFNPKIHRIKFKFLSEIEKEIFDIDDIQILTLIWSVKEAIYKMEDIEGLLFKENILIQAIKERGEVQVIKNNQEHHYQFDYLTFDDSVITFCYLTA
jgi:phosphopantetheinyl transferase (holo-ACP synthase)